MPSTVVTRKNDIADPILYRLYFGLMMPDILHKLGFDATPRAKEMLHEFHKRILGYESIAGKSQDIVSVFLFEICCFWASECGMFVRTKEEQPLNLLELPLKDCWKYL